jgi:hypothetical protein
MRNITVNWKKLALQGNVSRRRSGKTAIWAMAILFAAVLPGRGPSLEPEVLCGNENQRVCTTGDWEYWAQFRYTGKTRNCEFDLAARDGICRNSTRRTLPRRNDWTSWAMSEQRYHIGSEALVSRIATVGAHNAFSNDAQGFTNPITRNQSLSITDQLQFGVRAIEIDISYYGGHLRICHGKKFEGCSVPGFSASRLLADGLIEIRNWLRDNPGEVISLKFDDFLETGVGPLPALVERYLGAQVYQSSPTFTSWPTMGEIRKAGKQVLVILQNVKLPYATPWIWGGTNYHALHASLLQQPQSHQTQPRARQAGDACLPVSQGKEIWVEVAEGLAITNAVGLDTGFMGAREVRAATQCNVGVIGLDYVNATSQASWPAYRRRGKDDRLRSAVWSWKDGDYGLNGPAALAVSAARWESSPAAEPRALACASGSSRGAERQWKVTRGVYPWDLAAGRQACRAEFGAGYSFSFPLNGYENRQLTRAALAAGVAGVWLAYRTGDQL